MTDEKTDPKAKPAPGATPAPGAKPAAPAAPAPATPAPAAPAPASTPKGAKQQTEAGVEKGDNRNREATGVDEAKTPAAGTERMKGGL